MKFLTVAALLIPLLVLSPTSRAVQVGALANVNAASFRPQPVLAPDMITSAFGQRLATTTVIADSLPLPTMMAGTNVVIRDSAASNHFAQLFFVSSGQVNYVVPSGVALGPASVTITNSLGEVSRQDVTITQINPGVFSANADGQGCPAVIVQRIRPDGTEVYETACQLTSGFNPRYVTKPIDVSDEGGRVYLQFYGTGFRRLKNTEFSSSISVLPFALYAGPQGGFAGLDQVNIELKRSLIGRGEVSCDLNFAGLNQQGLVINIK